MNKPWVILGGGGHAAVVVELLLARKERLEGYVAKYASAFDLEAFGLKYLGTDHDFLNSNRVPQLTRNYNLAMGIGSIGDPTVRRVVFEKYSQLGFEFPKCIHPTAWVPESASLGPGTQVMAGAVIQTGTRIDENCIINTASSVDHHCRIGSHCHIAPGARLSGEVTLADGVHVGIGASIVQGVQVEEYAVLAAGAVILKRVEARTLVMGVPAKVANPKSKDQTHV